ncbi:MAG: hypothetical protein GF317_24515 [Candidatus Lokiarchaeota archaeon]|nr:hypothetical protein [Candidatus Lokiarchaeota archaeon]
MKQTRKEGNYIIKENYYNNGHKWYEYWYKDGKLDRKDGPAVQHWYENGQKWYNNGQKEHEAWYKDGKLDRKDGPAVQHWYVNGQKSFEYWYLNGKEISEREFVLLNRKRKLGKRKLGKLVII